MESQRNFLIIALAAVTFYLFLQWEAETNPATEIEQQQTTQENVINNGDDFVPTASINSAANLVDESIQTSGKLLSIKTDVFEAIINTQGGDLVDVKLLKYETEQHSGIPLTILQNGKQKYIAQSGLTGANGPDRLVKGRPIYQVEATDFTLADGSDELVVPLTYIDKNGLSVVKSYIFKRNNYAVTVDYQLTNNLASNASVELYAQLKQSSYVEEGSAFIPTYRGAAYSTTEDNYEKYDFDDIADVNLNQTTQGGWVAMLQHYFVSAWVPKADDNNFLYTKYHQSSGDAIIGFKAPSVVIAANGQATTSATLYVGPKNQEALENIADGLDLTVDYGILSMISKPLFWLLTAIQSVVVNWGIAIILITIIVKGAMYPLTKAQYTSMARMRELQPKITQLKERFGDDRQKMSQGMMELYKKEKVNPAGGCLPIVVQMPIFLALYWVFLESVELRHATFGLWIHDLSSSDPYYILPALMGLSMFVMQKMQPMTIQDPMQQKIMQYMPVVFSVFFFFFPAGLVLYWLVSNLISIVQMKIIFAGMAKAKLKAKN